MCAQSFSLSGSARFPSRKLNSDLIRKGTEESYPIDRRAKVRAARVTLMTPGYWVSLFFINWRASQRKDRVPDNTRRIGIDFPLPSALTGRSAPLSTRIKDGLVIACRPYKMEDWIICSRLRKAWPWKVPIRCLHYTPPTLPSASSFPSAFLSLPARHMAWPWRARIIRI